MADLFTFLPLFQETAEAIRARMDADINANLDVDDPRWVDTREGSFYYDVTQTALLEIARLWDAISLEVPASAFPLFAWGEYLDEHAAVFDLERKAAVAATGEATFAGDEGTFVAAGTIISADAVTEDGEVVEFQTTESGTTGTQLDPPADLQDDGTGAGTLDGTYYYVVTAYNEFGETTVSSEFEWVAALSTSVDLDWDAVAGADGYYVYRGDAAGGPYGRIADVVAPTSLYTDDGSVTPSSATPSAINTTAGVILVIEAVQTGTIGNLAALAITNLDTPNTGIDEVRNDLATSGGANVESDEDLRTRILFEFEGQGGGNQNDYRSWALAYPGVGEAHVVPVWDGPGTVLVVIMDADGNPVSGTIVDGLQEELDPNPGAGDGRAPIGHSVTVATPAVAEIEVAATITFLDGYSLDGGGGLVAQRTQIEDSLRAYIDELEVGDDVVYDHVKAQFFAVPGVYTVAGVTVNGGTSNVTVTLDPPEVAQLTEALLS